MERIDPKVALEIANGLPAVKKNKLQVSAIAEEVANHISNSSRQVDIQSLNRMLEGILTPQKPSIETKRLPLELTPDILITSDFMSKKITPWVELVRKELFRAQQPPFDTLGEAEQWMESQSQEATREDLLLEVKAMFALQELNLYQGHPFTVPSARRSFFFIRTDGWPHPVYIREPPPQDWTIPQMREKAKKYAPFNWLENETRIMARGTGFTQLSLLQFVLVGIKPILPSYESKGSLNYQSLPSGEEMFAGHIHIDIRANDLKFEELQKIYNEYRFILRLKRGKALTQKHWEIYQLVKKNSGPPKKRGTIVAFWKDLMAEWNELHPNDAYRTWNGIEDTYNRVNKTLEQRTARDRYDIGG